MQRGAVSDEVGVCVGYNWMAENVNPLFYECEWFGINVLISWLGEWCL